MQRCRKYVWPTLRKWVQCSLFRYVSPVDGFLGVRPIKTTSHGPLEHISLWQFEGDDESASWSFYMVHRSAIVGAYYDYVTASPT